MGEPAAVITMAFSIHILAVLLLSLLLGSEGRAIDERLAISIPDEYPSRCDDPFTPCKCLDRNSTRIVKDVDGVQHEVSFVSHVCDVETNKELEQPDGLQCEQIISDLVVFQLNEFLPYKSGCELRCIGNCANT